MRKKGKPWKCEKRGFELKCRKTCNDEKVQRTGEATWACAAPSVSFLSAPCKCATFEGGAKVSRATALPPAAALRGRV